MKSKILFLIKSVDTNNGGITQACLKQAYTFAEEGFDTSILTFDFNPLYPTIRKELLNLKKLHENVTLLNFYEEISSDPKLKMTNISDKKVFSIEDLSEGHLFVKNGNKNAYRVYDNGLYIKYVSFRNDGTLNFIDFFNESRYRTKRSVYDKQGILRRNSFMDYENNKPKQNIYYDSYGKAYATTWQNPSNGITTRMILFKDDQSYTEYAGAYKDGAMTDWVNSLLTEPTIVVSDTRDTDVILKEINSEIAFKVWRLHSGHMQVKNPNKLVENVEFGFKNMKNFDMALFLTNEQKNDIEKKVGKQTQYKVIPHYHIPNIDDYNFFGKSNRDEKLAVIVSRFAPIKQIHHSIKAFRKVVQEVPDAKLEIWGSGNEKDNYLKLIKELNLKSHVTINEYTNNPDTVYQKALFSVFTSKREGFGLSCLESLTNGCPVITYNIKYGPNDMINDSKNGFLITPGDINALADQMIYLFKNPRIARKMGSQANRDMKKTFNYQNYKEKWLEVAEEAIKKFN